MLLKRILFSPNIFPTIFQTTFQSKFSYSQVSIPLFKKKREDSRRLKSSTINEYHHNYIVNNIKQFPTSQRSHIILSTNKLNADNPEQNGRRHWNPTTNIKEEETQIQTVRRPSIQTTHTKVRLPTGESSGRDHPFHQAVKAEPMLRSLCVCLHVDYGSSKGLRRKLAAWRSLNRLLVSSWANRGIFFLYLLDTTCWNLRTIDIGR